MSNQYFNHQELIKRFKLLATKELPDMRVFDRTVGMFYTKRTADNVIDYTPIKINKPGMADAYGLIKTRFGMIHICIEFKTGKAVQTQEQKNWQNFIENMGGKYFIIRDEVQGVNDIRGFCYEKGYL